MKFRYTILYVQDVRATIDFYKRAFGTDTEFIHEAGDYGQLCTGDTRLAFASLDLQKSLGKSPGEADPAAPVFEIAFETGDVEAAVKQALEAGAKLVQVARMEPWGQTTAYVSDLNGFLVEICSPVADVV